MAYGYYYPYQAMQGNQYQNNQYQNNQNGIITVRSIDEARMYPVAPGNSITFRDENAPYIYTKTMGFSQLDRPIFEKYRLMKEEDAPVASQEAHAQPLNGQTKDSIPYALKSDIEALTASYEALRQEVELLKEGKHESE